MENGKKIRPSKSSSCVGKKLTRLLSMNALHAKSVRDRLPIFLMDNT